MVVLVGPSHPVESLAFSPDGAKLYAAHGYVGAHVWDLAARTVAGLDTASGARVWGEFVLHPGGRWAFGRCPQEAGPSDDDHDARAIDLTTGRTRRLNFLGVVGQNVAVSPSGRQVATVGHSEYDRDRRARVGVTRLYGWTVTAAGPRYAWHRNTPDDAEARSVAYLGEERLVVVDEVPTGGFHLGVPPRRHRVTVRSAAGKPEAVLSYPQERVDQVLASPDGKHVVARLGTSLWVWGADDWERPPTAVERNHNLWLAPLAAAFHPSGEHLLLAVNGLSVVAIGASTCRPAQKWKWDIGPLRAVAVSADGKRAAAAGPRGSVVVWDLDL